VTHAALLEVVATNSKKRFALSDDGLRIRASQGHSVDVDLGYEPSVPPELLYDGTIAASFAVIQIEGLNKMARHLVHVSPDVETARIVGRRRGAPVILQVRAGEMHRDGFAFFLSNNGVWLVEQVPPSYLDEL